MFACTHRFDTHTCWFCELQIQINELKGRAYSHSELRGKLEIKAESDIKYFQNKISEQERTIQFQSDIIKNMRQLIELNSKQHHSVASVSNYNHSEFGGQNAVEKREIKENDIKEHCHGSKGW